MQQPTPTAPVLSPVNSESILMNFDGTKMSSDAWSVRTLLSSSLNVISMIQCRLFLCYSGLGPLS